MAATSTRVLAVTICITAMAVCTPERGYADFAAPTDTQDALLADSISEVRGGASGVCEGVWCERHECCEDIECRPWGILSPYGSFAWVYCTEERDATGYIPVCHNWPRPGNCYWEDQFCYNEYRGAFDEEDPCGSGCPNFIGPVYWRKCNTSVQ